MREIAANHEVYKLLVIGHVRSAHPRKHGCKLWQAQNNIQPPWLRQYLRRLRNLLPQSSVVVWMLKQN